jgi:hypothetical protein
MPYLSYPHPYTAKGHCVTPLLAMGLGTLVEPAHAQLSIGCQNTNGTSNRSSSHSQPFLLNNHCTWKAGETVRGTMPRRAFVIGAGLVFLSVFSKSSFAAPDWSLTSLRDSVATSVWASGSALLSDARHIEETNTSQVEGSI